MSGIVGVFDPTPTPPPEAELRRALSTMERRGADRSSYYREGPLSIAFALFDPSDDGRHPGMAHDPESGARLFVDGVLDDIDLRGEGARRLMRDLEASPCETLAGLRGDFALALWSPQNQKLLLARDQLGTRPMLVSRAGKRVSFASRPRAIESLGLHATPDSQALGMMLQLGTMPAPWSGWAGIERLHPGECVQINQSGFERKRFWTYRLQARKGLSEAGHVRDLRAALESTTGQQTEGVRDPVFCMSGGVDSTAIAAFGRRVLGRRIRTVCLGFAGSRGDDRPFARRAAAYLDTEHEEIEVTPETLDQHLDEIAQCLEIPSLLSYPEYFLSKSLSGKARLLITGEIADSQFGGTSPFKMLHWLRNYQRLPQPLRRGLARATMRTFPQSFRFFGKHPLVVWRLLDDWDRASATERYLRVRRVYHEAECLQILSDATIRPAEARAYIEGLLGAQDSDPMDAMIAGHILHEAPNEYLADDYKLSAPLVYRSPYASLRVAGVAAAVPSSLKVKGSVRKYILLQAVKDLLPPETLTRPKMGFSFPMAEWLAGPLRHRLERHLAPESLPPFLSPPAVKRELDAFLASPETVDPKRVWVLMTLSLWARAHFR